MTTAAIVAATGSHFVMPRVQPVVAYQIENTAAIDDSPSTVGISEGSDFYIAINNALAAPDADPVAILAEVNARLQQMQDLGVENVRLLVPWAGVQPVDPALGSPAGDPNWGALDLIVNAAHDKGMGILGVLNSTPWWATESTPINGQPADFNEFADFAKQVALRYGEKIGAYEVWNEPNAAFFWNPVDPVDYTNMLKVTYTKLKEASAELGVDITVIGAVVGAGLTRGDLSMNPVDFVQAMYNAGANGYFDALSFHPYKYDLKFSEGDTVPWYTDTPLYQAQQLRALMDSYLAPGQEQLKMWISEYGLPTNVVSEEQQRDYIVDFLKYWQSFAGAGPVFLYTTQDTANPGEDTYNDQAHFGLYNADGSPKAIALILKDLIKSLQPETPTNPVSSLLQMLGQLISNVLAFVPNLVSAVVTSVVNAVKQLFSAIGGLLGGQSAVTTSALSAARAGTSIDAAIAEDVAPDAAVDETAAAADEKTKGKTEAVSAETQAAEGTVTEEPVVTEPVAEPVVTEPAVTEPVVTEPAVTEPVVTEPAVTEPVVTEPVVTEPEKPAGTEESSTSTESTEPEPTKPDATKPATTDTTKPDTTKPDSTKPDSTKPDSTKPGTTKPDTTKPDTKPDTSSVKSGHGTTAQTAQKPSISDKPRHGGTSTPAATTPSQRENDTAKSGAASSGASGSE
ncbi:cellulase family glycosylhydrolase [Mycolicibacterium cosmeticum]|uniref:cellulase family glycosylhydrolase n=1 Tax=Mycolicibacterium cosmeticum TaxID=258533 RepID=UPI003204F566